MSHPPQVPDDSPYRHYSARHRLTAWISQSLFDQFTYTVRHGLNRGMKRKGGLGWIPEIFAGSLRTPEYEYWSSLDLKDAVVYDIGAFHGILTLFFARQARQVVSYEPNSRNHARLLENIRLNRLENVIVRKTGAGAQAGQATMVAASLIPGGASIDGRTVAHTQNSNLSSESEDISIVTLDEDIAAASLPPPSFIKIDIEGGELSALRGAERTLAACRPRLFLEMHGGTMREKCEKVGEIVDFLSQVGYQGIRHVETGTSIGQANSKVAAVGHLDCHYSPAPA